jgi:hypothetical protein
MGTHLAAFLERCLLPGDTFANVGANIGLFLVARIPSGRQTMPRIANEAFPASSGESSANSLTNLRVMNAAASDHYGS